MLSERAPTPSARRTVPKGAAVATPRTQLVVLLLLLLPPLLAARQAIRRVEANGVPQPPPPDCPEVHVGRRLYVLDNKCYEFVVSRPSNWLKAYEFCEEHGGQLVQIKSDLVQNFLARKIEALGREYQDKSYWIGANDRKSEGVWQWTDGTRLSYTKWFAKLPRTSCGGSSGGGGSSIRQCPEQADCAIMKPKQQYRWFDSQCRSPDQAFICEHYYVSSAALTTTTTSPPPPYDAGSVAMRLYGDRGRFLSSPSSSELLLPNLPSSSTAAASIAFATPSTARTSDGSDRWQHGAALNNTSRSHWSPLRYFMLLNIHAQDSQRTASPRIEFTPSFFRATSTAARASESPALSTTPSVEERSTAANIAERWWSFAPAVSSIAAVSTGNDGLSQRPPARRSHSATSPGSVNGTRASAAGSEVARAARRRGNSTAASPNDDRRPVANRPPSSAISPEPSAVTPTLASTTAFTTTSPAPVSNENRGNSSSMANAVSTTQAARIQSATHASYPHVEAAQQNSVDQSNDEGSRTTTPPYFVAAATENTDEVAGDDAASFDINSEINEKPREEHQGDLGDGLGVLPAADGTEWESADPHHVGGNEVSGGGATATAQLDLTVVIAASSAFGVVLIGLAITATVIIVKRRRLKNGHTSSSPASSPLSSSPPSIVDYTGHRRGPQWLARPVSANEHCSAPASGCPTLLHLPTKPQPSVSAKQSFLHDSLQT